MNTKQIATIAALALAPFSAAAGNMINPAPTPVVPAPAPVATDSSWGGFYGGLTFGAVSGGLNDASTAGSGIALEDTTGFGLIAGYNLQRGRFVYGGELHLAGFETTYEGYPSASQKGAIDLRGRVGYAVTDDLLAFGFVGASRSILDESGTIFDQTGVTYGLGVDYMVTDNFFAGLEYSTRDVRDEDTSGAGTLLATDVNMISFRAGYQF